MVSLSENTSWPTNERKINTISRSELIPSVVKPNLAAHEKKIRSTRAYPAKVACHWAEELHTCFFIAVESETDLRQLRLPAVSRVGIMQEFDAMPDDVLRFDYLTAMHCSGQGEHRFASVTSTLRNLDTGELTVLFSRNMNQREKVHQRPSSKVESLRKRIEKPGRYELQFNQQLKDTERATQLQLWVTGASVGRDEVQEIKTPLISLSCLGIAK